MLALRADVIAFRNRASLILTAGQWAASPASTCTEPARRAGVRRRYGHQQ